MTPVHADARSQEKEEGEVALTVVRNVSTRYLAIAVEGVLGVVILPFNVSHLGQAAYGLWILTASITAYFSILDLGYSGALVKFVAQYRAKFDSRALNEILSTAFFLFAGFGLLTYLVAIACAVFLGDLFKLTPDQISIGRAVLLIVSVNVAMGTAFSVYGAVINGFQRYDLNNVVGTISTIVAAIVNVVVLSLGYGLIALVTATTVVRVLTLMVYRANAYRVFSGLRLRPSLFGGARLREMTGFSVYVLIIDWANKINYSIDALVIGMFLNTSAVAVWAVGQRVAETIQRLSNQFNEVLFPAIVDSDVSERIDRLQRILIQGTRLSLASAIPLAGAVGLLATPLMEVWVGPAFAESAIVLQVLCVMVIVRTGNATAGTLLRGAGRHKLLAFANASGAITNLALSVALVKPLGLPGVALGTLIPVALVSSAILFPAGCRRVGISYVSGWTQAVWPALWPASVMALFILLTEKRMTDSLVAIGAEVALAGLVYLATFIFFGISSAERRLYFTKVGELTGRFRLLPVSESA